MITKEKAIQILDDYFEVEYNIDPLYTTKLKAHRLYIYEEEEYWTKQYVFLLHGET